MMALLHSFTDVADGLYFSVALVAFATIAVATLVALFTRQIMRRQGLTRRKAFSMVLCGLGLCHLFLFVQRMSDLTNSFLLGAPIFIAAFLTLSVTTLFVLRAITRTCQSAHDPRNAPSGMTGAG